MRTQLECQHCHAKFVPTRTDSVVQKYCSMDCYGEAKKTSKEVACNSCNVLFSRQPSLIKEKNYCSRECSIAKKTKQTAEKKEPPKFFCETCKREYKPSKKDSKYCSRKCKPNNLREKNGNFSFFVRRKPLSDNVKPANF